MLYDNVTVVGLGYKARQGKDTSASYFKYLIGSNAHILHFADGVYEEVNNKHRLYPLIEVFYYDDEIKYHINTIDNENGNILYTNIYNKTEVPALHNIFLKKSKLSNDLSDDEIYTNFVYDANIQFWGQNEKMPLMLQFWGTDFRREKCSNNYWINKVKCDIDKLINNNTNNEHLYFFIPDTRFINEFDFIKTFKNSHTIKINRMITPNKQYIDDSRNPNHSSEIELTNSIFDYTITALNLDELFSKLDEMYKIIIMENL